MELPSAHLASGESEFRTRSSRAVRAHKLDGKLVRLTAWRRLVNLLREDVLDVNHWRHLPGSDITEPAPQFAPLPYCSITLASAPQQYRRAGQKINYEQGAFVAIALDFEPGDENLKCAQEPRGMPSASVEGP